MQATKVLPQVGLDVETSANCIAVLQSGLDECPFGFCLLSSSKVFKSAFVPGWTLKNPPPAAILERYMPLYDKSSVQHKN